MKPKGKTRLAFLTTSVSRRAGGLFDAVRNLAGSLRKEETIQVFGIRDPYTDADSGAWGQVSVSAFQVVGPAALGFAPGLERALELAQPEIVHVHGLWTFPSVASLRWAKGVKPYVISPHGMLDPWAVKNSGWKKRLAGAMYENRHLRGATCLHALNQAEAQSFREYGMRNPVCVVPNGVDVPAEITPISAPWEANQSRDTRFLFYIGRLHPKKGLDILLRAWSLVQHEAKASGWRLAIAGWDQGGYEQKLRAMASALAVNSTVCFIGPQFGETKIACFQASHAFILPSLSEGLPMTVLEAWSHQCPVLMTPQCNLPDGFQVCAALRIEPDDESIAAQLRNLFNMTDAERSEMGERGLRLVKERYQWQSVATKMTSVYEWMLGKTPAPDCLLN